MIAVKNRGAGMSFKTIALAGATLSLFLMASHEARAADGWYASVEGGAVWTDEWDHLRTKIYRCYSVTTPAEAVFETGWAALGAIGYALRNWRVEIEGGYRHNEMESYEKNGWTVKSASGELTEISAMMNVIYDVPVSEQLSLSVGVGAGGDHVDVDIKLPWQSIAYEDWRFAYQGLAGVNYAFTHSLAMFVNYRYLYVDTQDFQATPTLHIDGEELIYHEYCDISIAVSAPKGLVVPVIRNAESLSMAEIEKKVIELAGKARDNKLALE